MEPSKYTTKATWLGREYGCRIFHDGVLVVEGRAKSQDEIGPVFRSMFRMIDKCGGDSFTHASRMRNSRLGNRRIEAVHYWGGRIDRNSKRLKKTLD